MDEVAILTVRAYKRYAWLGVRRSAPCGISNWATGNIGRAVLKFGRSQVRMNSRLALLVVLLARTAVGFAGVLAAVRAATEPRPVADCNLLGSVFKAGSQLELE
jgi:hypothetical protein